MNVIAKIPQSMTEFLHIGLQQTNLAGDIYELRELPFVEMPYASIAGFRTTRRSIEACRFPLRRPEENGFKHAAAKKYHGEVRARR